MSKYEIIDNIEIPQEAVARNRQRSEFSQAVDSLEVGQGFRFPDSRELKNIYPSVAPKKFPSATPGMAKRFQVVKLDKDTAIVKRLPDQPQVVKHAKAATPAADHQAAATEPVVA